MPEFSAEVEAKLTELEAMVAAGKSPRYAEVLRIDWPLPDGTRYYCYTQIDAFPGFRDIPCAPLEARVITGSGAPFFTLPQTASISDDAVDFRLSDLNGDLTRLLYTYGQGVRVRVYSYYPDVDLFLESWQGTLRAPKDSNGVEVKLSAVSGWRSPNLLLPRRLPAASCQFVFGGLLSSQAEIDAHKGCPYNAHLTEEERDGAPLIGVPGFADCPRNSKAVCMARLVTDRYWPGFNTLAEAVRNNQTQGPNLMARSISNQAAMSDPIRVIFGEKDLHGLRVIAYRAETNTKHPDKGWGAALFEVGEGPLARIWGLRINNVFVGLQHENLRDGSLGQSPTSFSPNVNTFSGTAVAFGRVQGNFAGATASAYDGSVAVWGLRDIRVYSDEETFVEQYTKNRLWCLLRMLTDKRWGFGEDYARYSKPSAMDAAAWCDEQTSFTDANGNVFQGTRSTFNAELAARATQQQVNDLCVAGRLSPPFEFEGLKHIVPLRRETIDDSIPVFTTVGRDNNICADRGRPLISWTYTGDDELINQVVVTYEDLSQFGAEVPLTFGDTPQQLKAGRAWGDTTLRVIPKTYPGFGINNFAEAARLGNFLLYLGPNDAGGIANNLKVTFTTFFSRARRVRPYGLVKLVVPELEIFGFDYFRVLKRERLGDLKVRVTAQAYPVDFYERMESVVQPAPVVVSAPGLNPGGRRGEMPELIAFSTLSHTSDTIYGRLQQSAL